MWRFQFHLIFSSAEDLKVHRIYELADKRSSFLSKAFMWTINIGALFTAYFPSVLSVAYNIYFRDNHDPKTYFIALKVAIPFIELNNMFDYLIYFLCNVQVGYGTLLMINSVLMFFVSCCIYLKAACDHFIRLFDDMDDLASLEPRRTNRSALMKKKLRDAVRLHINLSQWVLHKRSKRRCYINLLIWNFLRLIRNLSRLYSMTILTELSVHAIIIASALFQFEEVSHFCPMRN